MKSKDGWEKVFPIETEDKYKTALKEIETLMSASSLTPQEEAKLDILVYAVERYEDIHFPMKGPAHD